MNEDKKTFLTQLINQLEIELESFWNKFEDDHENISDEEWEKYDDTFLKLYRMLEGIKEEIYLS